MPGLGKTCALMPAALPAGDFVADFRGAFVFFGGDGVGKLLVQGFADFVFLTQRFLHLHELVDQFVLLELLFGLELDEELAELLQAAVDFLDGRLRAGLLQRRQGTRLHAVKQHERPVLLVRNV